MLEIVYLLFFSDTTFLFFFLFLLLLGSSREKSRFPLFSSGLIIDRLSLNGDEKAPLWLLIFDRVFFNVVGRS